MKEEILKKFDITSKLIEDIENLVWDHNITYIEAIVHYSESNDLDIETVASMIGDIEILKAKVQLEAEDLHYLKKTARLPI